MDLNLLGKKNEKEIKKKEGPLSVEMYEPEDKESRSRESDESNKQVIKETAVVNQRVKKVKVSPFEDDRVDLASRFIKKQLLIRSLIIMLAVLILTSLAVGGYLLWMGWTGRPVETINKPIQPVINQPVVNSPSVPVNQPPVNTNQPIVTPPPNQPLTDTPLAPLRGSLIKFPDDATIFLVENNGELRTVDTANVTFKNGQTYAQISQTLIYQLPIKWKETRKSDVIVRGQVDYDPRVLTLAELLPFIR